MLLRFVVLGMARQETWLRWPYGEATSDPIRRTHGHPYDGADDLPTGLAASRSAVRLLRLPLDNLPPTAAAGSFASGSFRSPQRGAGGATDGPPRAREDVKGALGLVLTAGLIHYYAIEEGEGLFVWDYLNPGQSELRGRLFPRGFGSGTPPHWVPDNPVAPGWHPGSSCLPAVRPSLRPFPFHHPRRSRPP
ncbi:hypothetical protein CYMTET_19560 [Cymbomonas tetramitiformis]|uniref:Uncharacterized protein n=1 Tax=Cymbomonas tetramitiformis TaxID=36881 RepID=A0AAE0G6D3_9CHLO|nr:hypothetical protein CYMTET_19560 [Cymbomonas tetramitiformis]